MNYLSTRNNHDPVSAAAAITKGMVTSGGLFVPENAPALDVSLLVGKSYRDQARAVLAPYLTDFAPGALDACIDAAYSPASFDVPQMVALSPLDSQSCILELWHGSTAAFKDMALQIMPHFMNESKRVVGDKTHTVILVATSGDTGKAALEGFCNVPGISIVVFYPHNGVSEIQRLQMATTEGTNTHVIAVEGNFDDCQTGVKQLFGDMALRARIASDGFEFSSANSINWGRLCPQIVYYFHAYARLVSDGILASGTPVDFVVPTGNFGNILAGWYARSMGLPIRHLVCASNSNNVLTDFFYNGIYDRQREFIKTMSPSMDILLSSNLERFLFELTSRDGDQIQRWFDALASDGSFAVEPVVKAAMDTVIEAGWADEDEVAQTIADTWNNHRYVLDPHTAVAVAVNNRRPKDGTMAIIHATASPYKFSGDVVHAITGETFSDEFDSVNRLSELTGLAPHRAVDGLRAKPVRHDKVIGIDGMHSAVLDILAGIHTK
jgi:threonine synthase